jgi:hypothetical protein
MQPGTVYRGTPPPRDRLLLGALAFLAIAALVGAGFFVYGLAKPDDKGVQEASPPSLPASSATPTPSPSPSPSPAASPTVEQLPGSGPRFVHPKHSSLCLDTTQGVDPEGAPTLQNACTGAQTQQWTATVVSGNPDTYTLINAATGKCLDVFGESRDDGAKVVQWSCKGSANQLWQLAPAEDGGSILTNVNSDKCLGVAGGDPNAGAAVVQQSCDNVPAQHWIFTTG